MEKKIIVLGIFVFSAIFLGGCSMMPDDDEIINGSISESEIIDPELGVSNETNIDGLEDIDNPGELEDDVYDEENDEESADVEFQVAD